MIEISKQQKQAQVNPAQRNALFAQMTRQHWQVLPAIAGAEGADVSFTIPKSRLLARVRLLVTGTLTAEHAANNTYTPAMFAPYTVLNSVRMEINNGFSP